MSVQLQSFPFCVVEGRLVKTLLAGVLSDSVISLVFFPFNGSLRTDPWEDGEKIWRA